MHSSGPKPEQKKYSCEICGAQMLKGNLILHTRVHHTGERPFPCLAEDCDRRFFTINLRKIHMRYHTGEKPYQCPQCPNTYYTKSAMSTHFGNIHTDVRKHRCDECGMSFKVLGTFKKHVLTHTDIKPFHCDVCGRDFRQRYAFKVHMNIHTDNRPHKCRLCDLGFHSSAARRSHEKSVHKA